MNAEKRIALSVAIAIFLAAGSVPPSATAADYGQFGPFDFYDTRGNGAYPYTVVERHHLGPKTELMLRRGDNCGYWSDLDYTLRAFPNHPKALKMMADFLKTHVSCDSGRAASQSVLDLAAEIEAGRWQGRTMEYYFETGIKFRPQYTETRVLYARALSDIGNRDQAVKVLEEALKLDPQSSSAHYELGTIQLAKGDKQSALAHARKAYQLGKPPAALRDQLVAAGIWSGR